MPAYCVEYVIWSKQDSRWSSTTMQRYCFSLLEAQNLAASLRWNNDVEEDTVYVRLLTDKEANILPRTM